MTNKRYSNISPLRFPRFEDVWCKERLGEVATLSTGFAFPSEIMHSNKQSYQLIKMSSIYQGHLDLNRNPSFLKELDQKHKPYLLKDKDILISLTGTVGKRDFGFTVYLHNPCNLLVNQRVGLLRVKSSIVAKYIFYLTKTKSFQKKFHSLAIGGTGNQANVSMVDCKNIKIKLPSLSEQQKIAAFLTAVDDKLTQLQDKKDLLEAYKKGCMQKLFSQVWRFKDDNGKAFPDWEEKLLGAITSFVKDGTHGTHENCPGSPYLLLSAKNIENGRLLISKEERAISKGEYDSIYKNYSLEYGDLLLTIVGTIGRVAVYRGEKNIAFQRSVAFFRIDDGEFEFFYHLFLSSMFKNILKKLTVISAQPGVYLGELLKIKVSVPHPDEQQKVAAFLSAIDDKITLVSQELEQAKQFKQGLLQQMFV